MPKTKRKERSGAALRHNPLAATYEEDAQRHVVKPKAKHSGRSAPSSAASKASDGSGAMSESLSRKVMQLAQEQQQDMDLDEAKTQQVHYPGASVNAFGDSGSENDAEHEDYEVEFVDGDLVRRVGDYVEEVEINMDDEAALRQFMPSGQSERRSLADIIAEKIREQEAQAQAGALGRGSLQYSEETSNKVVEVYNSVGTLLSRYRAGKVPKAFKIIPSLRNWEEVLMLTNPEKWSPQAMFAATRIFASNLNPKNAQRFYNLILLPAVRDDIQSNRRLNYHYYRSLKKALYKPAAFFKGLLLPLCTSGSCTLREATIIGSVLSKVSIPMMHSAAAMLKMSMMRYSGVTSLFIRVLLDKKYSLPYRVVDAVCAHFCRFVDDQRTMPVIWHQCLLVFAQRYKSSLKAAQKQKLKLLLRVHSHHAITLEIRRELFSAQPRQAKPSNSMDIS